MRRSRPLAPRVSRALAAGLLALLSAACRTPEAPRPAEARLAEARRPEPTPPARTASTAAGRPEPSPPALRLPRAVAPLRSRATLSLGAAEGRFKGVIEHELRFVEASGVVWLNALGLDLGAVSLRAGGGELPVRTVPGGDHFVGVALAAPLPAGTEAVLRLEYAGRVSDKDERGLFTESAGGERYLFTQFEAIDARRVFPCFDEPSYKVPWQLTLEVPAGQTAVSNTPATAESPLPGNRKRVTFAETKPLPSYLVAFAVGPFDLVDAGRAGRAGTPIHVVVPRGEGASARYLARSAGSLLEALERYLGVPYPYEKLDFVVVPELVTFSAMENAGLITIHRRGSLARPEEETVAFQRAVAEVVTHELAHQWFGNLVTLAWWDDIWLNESFATWMEAEILSGWRPEWAWTVERAQSRARGLGADRLASARRVRQAIDSNDDIENVFDGVTYAKGSAVLSMLVAWLGRDAFGDGLRRYFAAHAHGTATSSDVFRALSAAAGREVAPVFSSFLDQPGVPELRVELDLGARPPALRLEQRRFLPVGSAGDASATWQLPVCVRYEAEGKAERACTLLGEARGSLTLDRARRPPRWLVPNEGGLGYYVTGYDGPSLGRVLDAPRGALSREELLCALHDAAALLGAGRLPAGEVLPRLPGLVRDPSPYVQQAAVGLAEALPEAAIAPELRPRFGRFLRDTFGPRARALGALPRPKEPDAVRLLRPELFQLVAGRGRDPALAREADRLARRWLERPGAVPEESVEAVLEAAAQAGDRALFDRLHGALAGERDPVRRRHLIQALGAFHDPALARDAALLYLGEAVDPREAIPLLLQGPPAQGAIFRALQPEFERLLARLPVDLRGSTPNLASGGCAAEEADEAARFFEPRVGALVGAPRTLAQVLEGIRLCAALKDSQDANLRGFLARP